MIYLSYIISAVFFLVLAEVFGRSKHIGKWWAFFLLLGLLLPGVIAIYFSPSAKTKNTKGTKNQKIIGYILVSLGVLNSIVNFNPSSIGLIIFGVYLVNLSLGRVVNNNPKYYLDKIQLTSSFNRLFFREKAKQIDYYINLNDNQEGPFKYKELNVRKYDPETLVWHKKMDNWKKIKDMKELESLVYYAPPKITK